MMDRSQLIRYANDSLLEEFQQRLNVQMRYIDAQMAMLKKELQNLQAERDHLGKFFPAQLAEEEKPVLPKMPQIHDAPGFLKKAAE